MSGPETYERPGGRFASGGAAPCNRGVQAHIGGQLRCLYDDMVQEPVPARFLELLARLEQQRDSQA